MCLDIHQCVWPVAEPDNVMTAPLLHMLMMCTKLHTFYINCSVLMSVIWSVLLLHTVMHNTCSFEYQLVLTNDLQLTRLYDIYALMLLYWYDASH